MVGEACLLLYSSSYLEQEYHNTVSHDRERIRLYNKRSCYALYSKLDMLYSEQDMLRPYLINFDATGSLCHELTSWDNSSSMSI